MSWQNVVFIIVTPLVLTALIAIGVVGMGSLLLVVHELALETYHLDRETASLGPVAIALGAATLVLVVAAILARGGPSRRSSSHSRH